MKKRRFIQCDVFTQTPTKGNGLAVVVDSDGLSDAQMQSFAAWTRQIFGVEAKLYKYIYAVLFVLITWGTATMVQTAKADEFEYHPRFGAIRLDGDVKAAIRKFPDLTSCLKSDSSKDGKSDLNAIDWDKIRNDGDAKVCLFMIFEQLGGPEEIKKWLSNQGFSVWGPIEQGYSPSLLRRFGYDVSHDAFNSYKNPGVGGGWSLEGQYPKFPTSGFARYGLRAMTRAQNIGVTWFPDGRPMEVRVTYQSIFN